MSTNDDFTRTFVLKQHTPLLHFQHEKPGATLRATEVKPKLDRFIIKVLPIVDPVLYNKFKNVINEDHFPISDHVPSPYKLSITAENVKKLTVKTYFSRNEQEQIPENKRTIGSYFGDLHKGIFAENINIKIFSLNPEITELVFESLKWLFLLENFGCRGTKGFGSFTWDGYTQDQVGQKIKALDPYFRGIYEKNINLSSDRALKVIHEDYQLLKSGRNFPYVKSELFQFMCKGEIGWEKRWIKLKIKERNKKLVDKEKIINLKQTKPPIRCGDLRYDWEENTRVEYKFIRALLGLSDKNEYLLDSRSNKDKLIVSISSQDKDITRFKSPLIFKFIFNRIYVFVNKIDAKMFDLSFDFSISIKTDQKSSSENIGTIKTPTADEFDLQKFIQTTFTQKSFNYHKL